MNLKLGEKDGPPVRVVAFGWLENPALALVHVHVAGVPVSMVTSLSL